MIMRMKAEEKGGSESRRESDEMKARNSKIKGIKKNHSISGCLRLWCGAARRKYKKLVSRLRKPPV